ncbi:MAG: hypothetical protein OXI88_21255 [Gammaproteobacteria bacterium]|nr:hypothetical protein [Gammaproteobacteria bacterium]MDE0285369.1 hypothetical protein [Gammaproteobacteria bacterium]MDE0514303.1 hypothetical protein [Gammaproteobacteria bacterium]
MTQVTLQLPQYMLQNAQKKGWLDNNVLAEILRDHLEYRKNHPELKKNADKMTNAEFENLIHAEVTAVVSLNKQGG